MLMELVIFWKKNVLKNYFSDHQQNEKNDEVIGSFTFLFW